MWPWNLFDQCLLWNHHYSWSLSVCGVCSLIPLTHKFTSSSNIHMSYLSCCDKSIQKIKSLPTSNFCLTMNHALYMLYYSTIFLITLLCKKLQILLMEAKSSPYRLDIENDYSFKPVSFNHQLSFPLIYSLAITMWKVQVNGNNS